MSYGITFDSIRKVHAPEPVAAEWGTRTVCASRPEYHLERLVVRAGAAVPSRHFPDARAVYFLEEGNLLSVVRARDGAPSVRRFEKGRVLGVDAGLVHGFRGGAGESVLYVFAERPSQHPGGIAAETPTEADAAWRGRTLPARLESAGDATQDFRDKYWGTIETIVSEEFAGKRIFIKKGGQASLEFHVKKIEAYYVHSGRVRVGVRTGRAENRSIVLSAGQSFEVLPGLMHMRIALEDTLIIEVSTRDDDGDSHLVEDGMKYTHVDIEEPR